MSGFLPPVVAELKAITSDFKAKMADARGDMDKTEGEAKSRFSGIGTAAKAGLAIGGAAAIGFAASSIKAALEGEKSQAQLETAIRNTGGSVAKQGPILDAAANSWAKYGYENDTVNEALAKLTTVTGSATKGLDLLQVTTDLAKGRNIDLSKAADVVGKVVNGNVGALGRLGIATKDAGGHTLTATQALAALQQKFGGSAQAEADTYSGKMAAFKATFANLQEEIGNKLIPILATLASAVAATVEWFGKHKTAAVALGVAVGVLVAGLLAVKVQAIATAAASGLAATASGVWTAAQWLLNAALDANPIGLIVIAIAAVVAAIVYAYNHFTWFRDGVQAVWSAIKTAFDAVLSFFTSLPGVIAGFFSGVASWLVSFGGELLSGLWNGITTGASAVWDFFTSLPGTLLQYFADAVNWLAQVGGDILSGLWNGITTGASAVWDFFTGLPAKVGSFLLKADLWLYDKGKAVLTGLWNGIKDIAESVWTWFSNLPDKIGSFLLKADLWLYDKGKAVLTGLWNGIKVIAEDVWTWFGKIGDKIDGLLTGAGKWLFDIGKKILNGLLDGLKAAWKDVSDFVGGLAKKIIGLKGPPAYDAVMLTPNGELIMKGLEKGLRRGYGGVQSLLKGMTADISGTATVGVGRMPSSMSAAGGGNTYNYITVQVETSVGQNTRAVGQELLEYIGEAVGANGQGAPGWLVGTVKAHA